MCVRTMGKQEDMRSSCSRKRAPLSYLSKGSGQNGSKNQDEITTDACGGGQVRGGGKHMMRMGGTGPSSDSPTIIMNPANFLLLPSSFAIVVPQYLQPNFNSVH